MDFTENMDSQWLLCVAELVEGIERWEPANYLHLFSGNKESSNWGGFPCSAAQRSQVTKTGYRGVL